MIKIPQSRRNAAPPLLKFFFCCVFSLWTNLSVRPTSLNPPQPPCVFPEWEVLWQDSESVVKETVWLVKRCIQKNANHFGCLPTLLWAYYKKEGTTERTRYSGLNALLRGTSAAWNYLVCDTEVASAGNQSHQQGILGAWTMPPALCSCPRWQRMLPVNSAVGSSQ